MITHVELKKSNMDISNSDCNNKKSNDGGVLKGNPLDGYWKEYETDYEPHPMDYNPFMARLGLVIMFVVAASLLANLVLEW